MWQELRSDNKIQTGLKIDKQLLNVLKGLASHYDCYVGEVVEKIIIASLNGESAFKNEDLGVLISLLRRYECDLRIL